MAVTGRELREIDIRESFRGYQREEVDDALERAAATIEQLERQVRKLQHRDGPDAAPSPVPCPDDDLIGRTLLLAQKTADDAVTEARAHAEAMVRDAEETARLIAERERRRAESEIAELLARREALSTEVDSLESFAAEYRDRIRNAIEDDFERLGNAPSIEEPTRPLLYAERTAE